MMMDAWWHAGVYRSLFHDVVASCITSTDFYFIDLLNFSVLRSRLASRTPPSTSRLFPLTRMCLVRPLHMINISNE